VSVNDGPQVGTLGIDRAVKGVLGRRKATFHRQAGLCYN
jgi:hypothetical protein